MDNKLKLLVIDGSQDLGLYFNETFQTKYECLLAQSGPAGIEIAIEKVPDLIVADVKLPLMDGFQVSQILRSTNSTSHIPIIVLSTNLDEACRIQGWKSQVDDFVAGTCSNEELSLRVERLLNIRQILANRFHEKIVDSEDNNAVCEVNISFSNKRDKEFYSRFLKVIESNYQSMHFGRSKAASLLAISDRQLNRKLAAMLDCNFSEYLRRYRLDQGAQQLLSGHQITEVCFNVGFSSPSYFANCFKNRFGCTPTQYVTEHTVEQPIIEAESDIERYVRTKS